MFKFSNVLSEQCVFATGQEAETDGMHPAFRNGLPGGGHWAWTLLGGVSFSVRPSLVSK